MAAGDHTAQVQDRPDFLFPRSRDPVCSQWESRARSGVTTRDRIRFTAATSDAIVIGIVVVLTMKNNKPVGAVHIHSALCRGAPGEILDNFQFRRNFGELG